MKCKVHIVNIKTIIALLFMAQLSACQTMSKTSVVDSTPNISKIEFALEEGRYYQARKMTEELMQTDPQNVELKNLMATILEKEIAEQKEVFEESVVEEFDAEQNDAEIRTWLDRAREFLHQGQYEQALLSAEEVFKYDPINQEASRYIDKIRKEVYAEGKQEAVFLKRMYRDEITQRVVRYKEEAKDRIAEGKYSQAKLILQKAMLLDPQDKEISHLYEKLQNDNQEKSA